MIKRYVVYKSFNKKSGESYIIAEHGQIVSSEEKDGLVIKINDFEFGHPMIVGSSLEDLKKEYDA